MKIGALVKLKEAKWYGVGVITEMWKGSRDGHTMCSVLWNKNMDVGLYFHDELETVCK